SPGGPGATAVQDCGDEGALGKGHEETSWIDDAIHSRQGITPRDGSELDHREYAAAVGRVSGRLRDRRGSSSVRGIHQGPIGPDRRSSMIPDLRSFDWILINTSSGKDS